LCVIHCMILTVEHKLNFGHLGISRVQQPEGFRATGIVASQVWFRAGYMEEVMGAVRNGRRT